MSRRHLNRDFPDASRTGVNTRVFPAFLQDRSEVRTAGVIIAPCLANDRKFSAFAISYSSFPFATRPSQLSALEKVRGRSADRRNCLVTAPRKAHVAMRFALGARRAPYGARTPTGAPPRLLHRRTNATAQPQAALPGTRLKDERVIRLRLSQSNELLVDRSSCRPGVFRAARERVVETARGYRTRSAFRIASGMRPSHERDIHLVTEEETIVNKKMTAVFNVRRQPPRPAAVSSASPNAASTRNSTVIIRNTSA